MFDLFVVKEKKTTIIVDELKDNVQIIVSPQPQAIEPPTSGCRCHNEKKLVTATLRKKNLLYNK